jgi:hypothetical protein
MIRLTDYATEVCVHEVAPAQIVRTVRRASTLGVYVTDVTLTDGVMISVTETQSDVARLLAAWERRYSAPEIVRNNDLPISVGMEVKGDGSKLIMFRCCQYTHDLNVEIEAKRKRGVLGRLFGRRP